MKRRALLAGIGPAGIGLALAGCGFHPLYGPRPAGGGAQRGLSQIQVALIPGRDGQLLRQALQRLFDRGEGAPKIYELSVGYNLIVDQVGFQQDLTMTRYRLIANATWALRSVETGATLTNGQTTSLDGVDVLDQQYFAADLAVGTTQRRLADAVGAQISQQVAVYLDQRAAA